MRNDLDPYNIELSCPADLRTEAAAFHKPQPGFPNMVSGVGFNDLLDLLERRASQR